MGPDHGRLGGRDHPDPGRLRGRVPILHARDRHHRPEIAGPPLTPLGPVLAADPALRERAVMSPAVVQQGLGWLALYRRVLARDRDARTASEYEDRSVIALAASPDGRRFRARPAPVLEPGGEHAASGVEDPTIVRSGGEFVVFYTGWSGWQARTATLLWARGPSLDALRPQGVAIAPHPPEHFVKEAEVRAGRGGFAMWCEVAALDRHERSRIAFTRATDLGGPWPAPVVVASPRPDRWDAVNVSTGPLLDAAGRVYMMYNGMIRSGDPDFVHAARIGLMEVDPRSGRVRARSVEPILDPPPGARIVFAASIAGDRLYYTVDDVEIWAARIDAQALGRVAMEPEASS
ncbi:MAG TPA: hypothetical protein VET65_04720 [Candidatus Limnocylindrales bacterium]|nr:hypothetical protein [Candidatus Limnocylindrales bacterium]